MMNPEFVSTALSLGLLAIGLAYTVSQKHFIKDRDNNVCQFPEKHDCCGHAGKPIEERKLHVHHAIPQRYSKEVGIEDPDTELNGITLCKNAHIGKIHPDISTAHTPSEFKKVFEKREQLLKEHKIYWVDKWDRLLHVQIMKNTERFKSSGRIFPVKRVKPK